MASALGALAAALTFLPAAARWISGTVSPAGIAARGVQFSAVVQRRSGEAVNVVSEGSGRGDAAGYRRSARPVLAAVLSMNALGLSESQLETLIGGRRPFFVPDAHPYTPSSGTSTALRVRRRQVDRGQLMGTGQMSKIF